MKFLALFFFLCCYGSVSGRRSAGTIASNSTRDRARCKIPGDVAGTYCENDTFQINYVFNNITKKCEFSPSVKCGERSGNMFASGKECYSTCDRHSRCLKPKKGLFSWAGFYKGFIYNPERDTCEPVRYFQRKHMWPRTNLFNSTKECHDQCMPVAKRHFRSLRKYK
uniref:Pancreatic trypsin inhibitor n=1 Tax=Rhipicephalus zambeziensis TaxID=60191 RepID=A0A224Y252_9ACAR